MRNGAPFKDWELPKALARVRTKLRGVEDGDRQMVDILTSALSDGLAAVEAACAEALASGTFSADVILNILARYFAPVTIDWRRGWDRRRTVSGLDQATLPAFPNQGGTSCPGLPTGQDRISPPVRPVGQAV